MIIDTHAHIGTLPPFDMTIDQLLYSMDAYGIDFTILSNIEGAENDHQGNNDTWPFNKAFYPILNVAWGGDWGGYKGIDETALPLTMEVDYVRVWQKE